jgi:3-deoxy-7-phosphoheptulonate synthase
MAAGAAGQRPGGGQPRRPRACCGQDDRLVVVVGPCSIHDHDQALDYARRLQAEAEALAAS